MNLCLQPEARRAKMPSLLKHRRLQTHKADPCHTLSPLPILYPDRRLPNMCLRRLIKARRDGCPSSKSGLQSPQVQQSKVPSARPSFVPRLLSWANHPSPSMKRLNLVTLGALERAPWLQRLRPRPSGYLDSQAALTSQDRRSGRQYLGLIRRTPTRTSRIAVARRPGWTARDTVRCLS